jgi:hypothetical protein
VCALAQDFSQEQDIVERNLLQRASRTREELLPGAPFLRRQLQQSSVAMLKQFAPWKTGFFPYVVSCGEIAFREILLLRPIPDKAHTNGRQFLKVLYKNYLKIQKQT